MDGKNRRGEWRDEVDVKSKIVIFSWYPGTMVRKSWWILISGGGRRKGDMNGKKRSGRRRDKPREKGSHVERLGSGRETDIAREVAREDVNGGVGGCEICRERRQKWILSSSDII